MQGGSGSIEGLTVQLEELRQAAGDGRVSRQLRVPFQEVPGGVLGLLEEGRVAGQVSHLQGREAVLALSEEVPGPPQAQVLLGNLGRRKVTT